MRNGEEKERGVERTGRGNRLHGGMGLPIEKRRDGGKRVVMEERMDGKAV